VYSVPQIPDRPAAIIGHGESPLPHMLEGVRTLRQAGAQAVAIACNTAHYWYDELVLQGGLPILHMADAACVALATQSAPNVQRAGLIATRGTVAAGFYQSRFAAHHVECVLSSEHEQDTLVLPAIECVKRNDLAQAHAFAAEAARCLLHRGAQAVVLGCTEIPLAIENETSDVSAHCIDATRALARACVTWWHAA
jgi:aspartate racemase